MKNIQNILFIVSLFSALATEAAISTKTFGTVTEFSTTRSNGTLEQFNAQLKDAHLVVVDFYAPWCGPCKALGPCIEKLASEFKNVKFIKVNIDKYKEVATKYNVKSIPQLLFFQDGMTQPKETLLGKQTPAAIKKAITKWSA